MPRFSTLLALACVALFSFTGSASALDLGFNDEDLLRAPNSSGQGVDDAGLAAGLGLARDAGASTLRVQLPWSTVAPTQPPTDADASDPAWPGYQWAVIDRQLRAVSTAQLLPLLWISRAPAWAEGPNRPPVTPYAPSGSWRPNAAALRLFAVAVAKRYSGTFPDPLNPGSTLPRITTFQGWNEPNLYVEITPQYVKTDGKFVNVSAGIFRSLLNAIYDGVKSVNPSANVIAGATAPFGDYPDGGNRTPPVEFWRDLLCEQTVGKQVVIDKACPQVRFDAYAHNPYSPYSPTRKALNPDDVTVPDLGKLLPLVKQAVAAKIVRPSGPKPLWITELSWDSTPDPDGLSPAEQASNVQGAISVLAKAGAQHILFWNSRDDAPIPSYDQSYQSGIFYRGATPAQDTKKPSWTAYRFPLTAYRSHGQAAIWGKAPAAGRVVVQRKRGATWKRFLTLRAGSDGVFSKTVPARASDQYRAVQGTLTSLVATS